MPFDAVTVQGSDTLQFISRDSSKPGRHRADGHECWVLVSHQAFAQRQLEDAPLQIDGQYNPQSPAFLDGVARKMLQAFADVARASDDDSSSSSTDAALLARPTYLFAQRWGHGYAAAPLQLPQRCASFTDEASGEPNAAGGGGGGGDARVVTCGDFCAGGGVPGAALSGIAAARKVHSLVGSSVERVN